MKTFIVSLTASIFLFGSSFAHHYNMQPMSADEFKNYLLKNNDLNAATCLLKSETTSGLNKICLNDCLGSEYANSINSSSICTLKEKN